MLVFLLLVLLLVEVCAEATHYDYLQIPRTANSTEIKKTYKKLVLKLHPDKYGLLYPNGTDEELAEMKDMFLKVQMAYEVLSDDDLRMKYDLGLDNPFSAHNDLSDEEVNEYNRYVQRIFHLYFQIGKGIRMYGKIEYDRPGLPEIKAQISVPLKYVFTGYKSEYKFKRKRVCPKCGGMGTATGVCNVCPQCGGAGHCNHIHIRDPERPAAAKSALSYEHLTETLCSKCKGKGCLSAPVNKTRDVEEGHDHSHDKCEVCNGRGTILQDATVPFMLPVNFADGFKANFRGHGHQDTAFVYGQHANYHNPAGRRVGDVNLVFVYEYPAQMSLKPAAPEPDTDPTDEPKEAPKSYDLIYDAIVSIKDLIFSSKVENLKAQAKTSKLAADEEILDSLLQTIDLQADIDGGGEESVQGEIDLDAKPKAGEKDTKADAIGGLLKKMLAKQEQIRKNRQAMKDIKIKDSVEEASPGPNAVNAGGAINHTNATDAAPTMHNSTDAGTVDTVADANATKSVSGNVSSIDARANSTDSLNLTAGDVGDEPLLNQTEYFESANATADGRTTNSTKKSRTRQKKNFILSVPAPTGDRMIEVVLNETNVATLEDAINGVTVEIGPHGMVQSIVPYTESQRRKRQREVAEQKGSTWNLYNNRLMNDDLDQDPYVAHFPNLHDDFTVERGTYSVHIRSNWQDLTKPEWFSLLAASDINVNDIHIRRLTNFMFPSVSSYDAELRVKTMYNVDPDDIQLS